MSVGKSVQALAACTHGCSNLPEDLMWLILLRCPVKSIFRFKCVSKTWDRCLSNSSFREAYISFWKESQATQPLLGFFNFRRNSGGTIPNYEERGPQGFSFLPTSTQGEPLTELGFGDRMGSFRGISNGLVLCGDHPNFHVFNPITRQIFSLPPAPFDFKSMNSKARFGSYLPETPGFVSSECDNDFKVILPVSNQEICVDGDKLMLIGMYSSMTGVWKESQLVAVENFRVHSLMLSTSIGGTFFWAATCFRLAAYDPDRADDRVQLIFTPNLSETARSPTLCQSKNGFLQCAVDSHVFPGLRVYTLAKKLANYGYDDVVWWKEWIPTYDVRLDMLDAIWIRRSRRVHNPQHDRYVVRMAYHPLNPLLLIFRMGHGIFCCDVEKGLIDLIPFAGHHFYASDSFMLLPYVQPYWPPSPV